MASAYIQLGPFLFWPTFRLRTNTYRHDVDIVKRPEILVEREIYESRKHIERAEELKRLKGGDA